MKKILTGLCAAALLCAVLSGCGGMPEAQASAPAAGMDLDAAIKEGAAQLEANIPEGTKIALVSVASSSAQLSEYVISTLESALVGGKKLMVVDRANLDQIRAEQGFQLSGEVDDQSATSIGKLLGAGAIVTGAFTNLGDVYRLTLKAITIETAMIAVSYPADIAKSARIETLLASGGGGAGGTAAASAGGARAAGGQAASPAARTYKVGDTGPAGGLVFYDKGSNSGGWRYLEAAPADIGNAVYSTEELTMAEMDAFNDDNGRGIGKGKYNTEYIMELAGQKGGGFGWAAQLCDTYEHNGFDDWFLPSQDELNYMYGNLYMRGTGDFRPENYWSSTGHWNTYQAWYQNFSDGKQESGYITSNKYRVRAVRQF